MKRDLVFDQMTKDEVAAVMEFAMTTGRRATAEQVDRARATAERDGLTFREGLQRVVADEKPKHGGFRF